MNQIINFCEILINLSILGLNIDPATADTKNRREIEIDEDIMAKSLKAFLVEENLN